MRSCDADAFVGRSYEWSNCDMSDEGTLREVYNLLLMNYVEDDDACFRCGAILLCPHISLL